jgi:outer membrane protein OmpA-like peptidoglycan-associated protein
MFGQGRTIFSSRLVVAALFAAATISANAQTIGYADAIDRFAVSCGKDIDKFCKKEPLGGGHIKRCLEQNQAHIAPSCTAAMNGLTALLHKRARARAAVDRVCERDKLRLCNGIEPGDGNLLECFAKVKQNVGAACRQMVADAGYDVSIGNVGSPGAINLSAGDIIGSLEGVGAAEHKLNASLLRQMAARSLKDPARANRLNRTPLIEHLNDQAQITIAIQFDFNSARIRPDSFRAIGLMADALYHPYLQGYHFLIVGHTDAKGSREYNLKLSQERADAVRDALINPFGIASARIEAVGLGEEQLLNSKKPEAAENRRVQLINIGK